MINSLTFSEYRGSSPMRFFQRSAARAAVALGRSSGIIRRLRPHYESLLNWATKGRGLEWEINGVTFRIDPHCRHQLARNYDYPVASFLRQRVKAGAICFDVGANVGVYVLQFAYWSRPRGRVVAFEPNPETRELLLKHVRLNGVEDRIEIVDAAIGATQGEAILYAAGSNGMSRLGSPNQNVRPDLIRATTVRTTTLDDFAESSGLFPDWLLIDIEGFEIAALAGSTNVIEQGRGRLGIVVEMHPNAWEVAGTTRMDAELLLSRHGLGVLPLTGQADPLSEHGLVCLTYQ